MGRDVKEMVGLDRPAALINGKLSEAAITMATIALVQDRRDDPERTDRWFFEAQLRFDTEADARAFFAAAKRALSIEE